MRIITPLAVLGLAGCALAMPTLDGNITPAEYGPALWVQSSGTGFGNNTDGSVDFSNGDELNAAYATIDSGMLYLGLTGNISTGFNKLNIAIDYAAGGQQTFSGLNDGLGNINGLTLDTGFEADAFVSYTSGNNPLEVFIDGWLADGGANGFLGSGTAQSIGASTLDFSVDNSNLGGVNTLGNPFDSDPATVTTGIEFVIDLAALGYTGGEVQIGAWINGGNNDFVSNQFIGAGAGQGNLGGDNNGNFTGSSSGVNFDTLSGAQFITIPAPGAMALMGLAGFAATRRRR